MSVDEVAASVSQLQQEHVVITGGEPMLQTDLIPLCQMLADSGKHITIETAGTIALPVACDLMSVSPKLSNSTPSRERAGAWRERHEVHRFAPEVIRALTQDYSYQFKFVVESPQDCLEIEAYLASFPRLTGVACS